MEHIESDMACLPDGLPGCKIQVRVACEVVKIIDPRLKDIQGVRRGWHTRKTAKYLKIYIADVWYVWSLCACVSVHACPL